MLALPGKPIKVTTQVALHRIAIERNEDAPQPFILQREKETFDHCSRSDALRCRVSRCNALSIAPRLVRVAFELTALVRDDVLRSAVAFDDTTEDGANVDRLRLLLQEGEAHHAPRGERRSLHGWASPREAGFVVRSWPKRPPDGFRTRDGITCNRNGGYVVRQHTTEIVGLAPRGRCISASRCSTLRTIPAAHTWQTDPMRR